jgi:hypothetical protein
LEIWKKYLPASLISKSLFRWYFGFRNYCTLVFYR